MQTEDRHVPLIELSKKAFMRIEQFYVFSTTLEQVK